jgi:predicted HTH domain antitoxin
VQEQLQLVTYAEAMRLAGLRQRVFYERLKHRGVTIYADQDDRRRRWILRDDVAKLAEPVKRRERTTA